VTTHLKWAQTRLVRSRMLTGSAAANYEPQLVAIHAVKEGTGPPCKTVCGRSAKEDELFGQFGPDLVLNGCAKCGEILGVEVLATE